MDIYGLVVLFFALVVTAALQTAFLFGAMFALHKFAGRTLPETTYGKFDFDHITNASLSDLFVRLAAIIFCTTLPLHLLEFLLVGTFGTRRAHPLPVSLVLFLLETAGIAGGLVLVLKADRQRTIPLAAAGAIFYLLLYGMFIYRDYLTA